MDRLRRLVMLTLALMLTLDCVAQVKDSTLANGYHPKLAAFVLPTVLISYGLISLTGNNAIRDLDFTTKAELQEDHPLFAAHADNYLQFSPAAAAFILQMTGIKGKHQIGDAIGIYVMSMTMMTGSVTSLKKLSRRERPDNSVFNSFPSGHTATVFASAEFLKQEYGDQYPWLAYTGYAVATATGALRMYNNRHWLSDVVAGAGFGILSTKASYILYPKLKRLLTGNEKAAFNMMPTYQNKSIGLYLSGHF
jgi:membrane-associated phospholipid phosphatase